MKIKNTELPEALVPTLKEVLYTELENRDFPVLLNTRHAKDPDAKEYIRKIEGHWVIPDVHIMNLFYALDAGGWNVEMFDDETIEVYPYWEEDSYNAQEGPLGILFGEECPKEDDLGLSI